MVRIDPAAGLAVQIGVLAALSASVGIGVAGWTVAVTYGLVIFIAVTRALYSSSSRLSTADWVTLVRATLVGGVAALTVASFHRQPPTAVLTSLAAIALALDWVDGQVARRMDAVTPFGARFDMEIDAFLILVLSVYVARSYGAWVIIIGLMRYALLVGGWAQSWLRAQLPPRYWRKVVAATVGIVLTAAASGVFPRAWTVAALVGTLTLLVESFGRDILWLWSRSPRQVVAQPTAGGRIASRRQLLVQSKQPALVQGDDAKSMPYERSDRTAGGRSVPSEV